jgi:hypothetical protein
MGYSRTLGATAVLLFGCESTPGPARIAAPAATAPVAEVVVCPAGSSYDAARNVCFATAVLPPVPEPKPVATEPGVVDPAPEASATGITVACNFGNGWAAIVPADKYPKDDQYLMQALIGLRDEPLFWKNEPDYAPFAPYAARHCSNRPERFAVPAGKYFILAGEANTFSARGNYSKNGFRKKVELAASTPIDLKLERADLKHTWACISCPWVAFFAPAKEGRHAGAFLPSFVVLANRRSAAQKGTDRIPVSGVPVENGRIRLRVVEAESELTHLDRLALEIGGKVLAPAPGRRSALALDDGVEVEITRGHVIELSFAADGVADGVVDAVVVATGYYDPLDD